MTATYDRHELRFLYPENWSISENEADGFVEISLESPEGTIWSVSHFPGSSPPGDLIESCASALREQYEDFEKSDFVGEVSGIPATGFDAHFYCLDFLVTAAARVFVLGDKTVLIFSQAESREFDRSRAVLDAITLSLLNQATAR